MTQADKPLVKMAKTIACRKDIMFIFLLNPWLSGFRLKNAIYGPVPQTDKAAAAFHQFL